MEAFEEAHFSFYIFNNWILHYVENLEQQMFKKLFGTRSKFRVFQSFQLAVLGVLLLLQLLLGMVS